MAVHFLIHLRLSLRCAPASAGQRIYRRLPQGALFSPVGLPRRPAALAQGAGVPDAEDLGRPFATAAWRGEARSSHCWRKVGVCVCDENYLCRLCFLFESALPSVSFDSFHTIDQEVRQAKSVSDLHFKCV